jgi:hypothetical protein
MEEACFLSEDPWTKIFAHQGSSPKAGFQFLWGPQEVSEVRPEDESATIKVLLGTLLVKKMLGCGRVAQSDAFVEEPQHFSF